MIHFKENGSSVSTSDRTTGSLVLEGQSCLWLVENGKFDTFLIPHQDGEETGALHAVHRVVVGEALVGFSEHGTGLKMVARPHPDTVIREYLFDQLSTLSHEKRAEIEQGLSAWISGIMAPFAMADLPFPFHPLSKGEEFQASAAAGTLLSRAGLIWVEIIAGRASFLGDEKYGVDSQSDPFPVAGDAWLRAERGCHARVVDFQEIAARKAWDGLALFQSWIFDLLVRSASVSAEKEVERLSLRRASDDFLIERSFERLASPIQASRTRREADSDYRDPLLRACAAIGGSVGFTVRPPAELLRGIPLPDPVSAIAKSSGVKIRKVVLKGEWWHQESLPMLAFLEADQRPVALIPQRRSRYLVIDGLEQKSFLVDAEFASTLNPFAIVFYRPLPSRVLSSKDILRFSFHGCGGDLASICLLGGAAGLLNLVTPVLTGIIFDRLIPGSERSQLMVVCCFLLIAAVASSLFTLTRGLAALRLESRLDSSLQAAIWDRILGLPASFFREFSSGDLALRTLGVTQIREVLTGATLTAILTGVFSVFNLILLFIYSVRLALLASALLLTAVLVSVALGSAQVHFQRSVFRITGSISGMLLQFVSGIAKFRISGTERRAFAAWSVQFAKQRQLQMRGRTVATLLSVFNACFPILAIASVFYYHGHLLSLEKGASITTGEFLAFLAAFTELIFSVLLLNQAAISAASVVPLYERAKPIFESLPEISDTKATVGRLVGNIEFTHITFRYKADGPIILNDLSLRISPGECIAFVGPSGSGKSTILRLLLGFELPEAGSVYLDGQDLSGLDVQGVRSQIGVVLQTSRPINGSIFSNIVGSSPKTIDDAWEAVRLAGLEDDIKKMPMGMHTMVSDGGGGLSGGQRQRLMIARAIVHRPRILVFDEATSALDNHTQQIVTRSLEALHATRIIIAHRLSTVRNADRICVLDRGSLVQSGSYDELISKEGPFLEMAKRQLV